MEYDRSGIPSRFDTGRTYDPETATRWMTLVSHYVPKETVSSIADVGAGTGRFTDLLAKEYKNARIVGIEPSQEMLAEAAKKEKVANVSFLQGRAESIPLADESTDLVFASMILHHVSDLSQMAKESQRVLRSGGTVFIRNSTRQEVPAFGRVYKPLQKRAEAEFPGRAHVIEAFTNEGFELVENITVPQQISESWSAYIERAKTKSDSMVARLTDEEFSDFLQALETYAVGQGKGQRVVDNIDLFVFRKK